MSKVIINGVEYTPFESGKNAKELGIDLSRKFIVVEESHYYGVKTGDIMRIRDEDGSSNPWFKREKDNESFAPYWSQLAYYDEPSSTTQPTKFKVAHHWKSAYGISLADKIEALEKLQDKIFNKHNTPTDTRLPIVRGNKIMSIVNFFNDLTVSSEDKELRKAGLKDSELRWTNDAIQIVGDLEAKERGYKDRLDLANKLGHDGVADLFQVESLIKKFYDKLLETAKKFNKKEEKK